MREVVSKGSRQRMREVLIEGGSDWRNVVSDGGSKEIVSEGWRS